MQDNTQIQDNSPFIIRMDFADSKVPEFKEYKAKDLYKYGEDNNYPQYLLNLYNKSAKHSAIINGKVNYIIGNGFEGPDQNWIKRVNSSNESLNHVMERASVDMEIFGGFCLQIIPNKLEGYNLHHVEFKCVRKALDGSFWYKKDWTNEKEKPVRFKAYYKGATEPTFLYYKEYRPNTDIYPLPGYLGTANYIETDIEISKFHLSSIKNGMMPSKMIQFFNGVPTDEAKQTIEKRLQKKYSGSENAGQFFLVFNKTRDEEVKIEDLSGTELDKLFQELNKTVQQEIFSGHQVTSPMLFGVKESGQLGGRDEIMNAYEIFKNTYARRKQQQIEMIVNLLAADFGKGDGYKIKEVEPLGFNIADFKDRLPDAYVFEKLGIDIAKYQPTGQAESVAQSVNENIKGLKGREYQNLQRIVREYKKGKLNRQQAEAMLVSGYQLTKEELSIWLDSEQFNKEYTEAEAAEMFAEFGTGREQFDLVHEQAVEFSSDDDMTKFEEQFYKMAFAEEVSQFEADVLAQVKKNKRATPEEIATILKTNSAAVVKSLAALQQRGIIERSVNEVGTVERIVKPKLSDLTQKPVTLNVQIRYTYEKRPDAKGGAIIDTTRPFCKKLIDMDKMYSRADIESVSLRLGYSVFDRGGGFWGDKPHCRHFWKANIVLKK